MSWATPYIEQLKLGRTVQFRPRGNSMLPLIKSGQLVTVEPSCGVFYELGEIVLCTVSGKDYLHLVVALHGDRYTIGNNRGGINGTISRSCIYGVCTKVED